MCSHMLTIGTIVRFMDVKVRRAKVHPTMDMEGRQSLSWLLLSVWLFLLTCTAIPFIATSHRIFKPCCKHAEGSFLRNDDNPAAVRQDCRRAPLHSSVSRCPDMASLSSSRSLVRASISEPSLHFDGDVGGWFPLRRLEVAASGVDKALVRQCHGALHLDTMDRRIISIPCRRGGDNTFICSESDDGMLVPNDRCAAPADLGRNDLSGAGRRVCRFG